MNEGNLVDIDLGDNHTLQFVGWNPDRDLNPQYEGIPDVERYGASIYHQTPEGQPCEGFVTFDGEVARRLNQQLQQVKPTPMWTVESWEPLTISPSVLCLRCRDHGFIRDGKWVRA